jgi:hypothetical protein
MAADPTYEPCIETLLEAIGRIGTSRGIEFLTSLAIDTQKHEGVRCAALNGLIVGAHGDEALLSLDIEKLGTKERCQLAHGLAKMESPFQTAEIQALQSQIAVLVADPSPDVRGRALAAWCLQSFEEFDGKLDREKFRSCLSASSELVIDVFFTALDEYRPAFDASEETLLVELGKKHPAVLETVVWLLKDIGGDSILDFMVWAYRSNDTTSLWALDYLSRHPSDLAAEVLRQEASQAQDASRACLAAAGLLRAGEDEAIDHMCGCNGPSVTLSRSELSEALSRRRGQ